MLLVSSLVVYKKDRFNTLFLSLWFKSSGLGLWDLKGMKASSELRKPGKASGKSISSVVHKLESISVKKEVGKGIWRGTEDFCLIIE